MKQEFLPLLLAALWMLFGCNPATGPIVVNSSISVRSKSLDSMTLAWSQAQDVNGNNETLEYQLVVSESPEIETLSDINRNARTVRTWGVNYTSTEVELTGSEQILYYNVMVRDTVGTISFYAPLEVDFTDRTAPTVADSTLTVSEITSKSLRLSWGSAADNNTAERDIVYVVMSSPSDNLNTVDDYYNTADGRHICFEKAAVTDFLIEALPENAVLYFNVFARDSNGNVTPYTPVSVTLLPPVTVAENETQIVYTYPLSADETVTLTLAVSDGLASGTLAADSPLWTTVCRWAAASDGNMEGQGLYEFEAIDPAAVSLSNLSQNDARLLSNALTEYTAAYDSADTIADCRYTADGAPTRTPKEAQTAAGNSEAAAFNITAADGSLTITRPVSP